LTKRYLFTLSLCLLVIAGSTNAARQRITLLPQPGVYSRADIEKEILFGREMAAIILADYKLYPDSDLNRYVNLVGQSIVRYANRPELEFYFAVIDSSQINAYAVPGGYIFITTATLGMMQNEAELAAVLAHEIAHVSDRHIVKALDIRADDESMTAIISKIVGSTAEAANVIFYQAIDHAMDLLFSKGLTANDEYAADIQGMYLAAFAGYDPTAYPRFLERIDGAIESRRSELNNTHPSLTDRIYRLDKIIADDGLAGLAFSKNKKRFERYKLSGG
jgi:predicted Zn-dependent protease